MDFSNDNVSSTGVMEVGESLQQRKNAELLRWLISQLSAGELNITLKHDNGKEYFKRKDRLDHVSCRCDVNCGGTWSVIDEIPKKLKTGWVPCETLIRDRKEMYRKRLERLKEVQPQLEMFGIDMVQRITDTENERRDILTGMKQKRSNKHFYRGFFPRKDVEENPTIVKD